MNIFDVRENLDAIVLDHDQQIKDLAAQLLELKQLVTPMMEFKRREWAGLTGDEIEDINKDQTLWGIIRTAEEILKEKNT